MTHLHQRLDKWLWYARFAKTRTSAQKLVLTGKVRVDRVKTHSPSKQIESGNVLTIALPRQIRVIEIIELAGRRGSFEIARKLYHDLSPPMAKNKPLVEETKSQANIGRSAKPTKHQRKKIMQLKQLFTQ